MLQILINHSGGKTSISKSGDESNSLKRTKRLFRFFYIISLFLSPLVGLISILILSYVEILNQIDWTDDYLKKSYNQDAKY